MARDGRFQAGDEGAAAPKSSPTARPRSHHHRRRLGYLLPRVCSILDTPARARRPAAAHRTRRRRPSLHRSIATSSALLHSLRPRCPLSRSQPSPNCRTSPTQQHRPRPPLAPLSRSRPPWNICTGHALRHPPTLSSPLARLAALCLHRPVAAIAPLETSRIPVYGDPLCAIHQPSPAAD